MCKCPEYKLHWDVFLFSILEMISVFYLMKTGKKYVFFWWGIFRKVDEGSRHGIKTFSLLCIDTPCLILWKKFSKKKKKSGKIAGNKMCATYLFYSQTAKSIQKIENNSNIKHWLCVFAMQVVLPCWLLIMFERTVLRQLWLLLWLC